MHVPSDAFQGRSPEIAARDALGRLFTAVAADGSLANSVSAGSFTAAISQIGAHIRQAHSQIDGQTPGGSGFLDNLAQNAYVALGGGADHLRTAGSGNDFSQTFE